MPPVRTDHTKTRKVRDVDKNPRKTTRKDKAKPGPKKVKARTSARFSKDETQRDLTWSDWLQVFNFMEQEPDMTQKRVVEHFENRPDKDGGKLLFTQSALSKKIKKKDEIRETVANSSGAGSQKRARVVTCPEVDEALSLWVQDMEQKKNTVTGAMLIEKRKRLEELLNVPKEKRLTGTGWLESFKAANNLQERKRHGEAGSVDLEAVEKERKRMRRIMAKYKPEDRWNTDETSFFPSAPPDRTLCAAPVAGQKQDKFRITAVVTCNSTGTEKEPLMFIGKSAKPRAFNRKDPARMHPPSYYRSNKKAWMTGALFDEFLSRLDGKMRRQRRKILLSMDNFSGHHNITYKPKNIRLVYFEPNLTPFVQPCDAGIIRCLKARYRKKQAVRALNLYEAEHESPFKIDILSAMRTLTEAWNKISQSTIANCWAHTKICPPDNEWGDIPDPDDKKEETENEEEHKDTEIETETENEKADATAKSMDVDDAPAAPQSGNSQDLDQQAWDVILEFATSEHVSLPSTEKRLEAIFGLTYSDEDWRPALTAVMDAEGDSVVAEKSVRRLQKVSLNLCATDGHANGALPQILAPDRRLRDAENELQTALDHLYSSRCLRGQPPSVSQILSPIIEDESLDNQLLCIANGDGGLRQILALVRQKNEVIDIDEDDDGDDGFEEFIFVRQDALAAIDLLQKIAQNRPDLDFSMSFGAHLRTMRATINHESEENKVQKSLEDFFIPKP
ncbi:unnamed protein product [Mycena citricolor]|uniref:HTH CENPB-type domain-containing protein n=1 Tax=Mycena citricolor TaxID=2018698 RepID=A0AAD2HJJ6_9AGAR|nr:unnamed protein product [Mycena citricolor]